MSDRKQEPEQPDWDDLKDIWQDSPPVDMARMARTARFVWWRMRFNFVLELLVSIAGVGVFAYLLYGVGSLPQLLLACAGMLLSFGGLYAAFRIRKNAWGEPGDTALSLVQLQIRRAQSAILYVKANNWLGIISLSMLPLAYWVLYDGTKEATEERVAHFELFLCLGFAVIVVVLLAMLPYLRRKQRELKELEQLARQLSDED
ncbi:hypothetical protein [Kordiimonas sp.]|uniref:hypothetical protein n=1 Tax=Kordiimonas sp. TaxID=1970157 RepID=UPI003A9422F2